MADPIIIADITAQQLEEMVGDGRATLNQIMRGQWEIKIGEESVGKVLTDTFKDEQVVMLGERVLGRFTNR